VRHLSKNTFPVLKFTIFLDISRFQAESHMVLERHEAKQYMQTFHWHNLHC